MDWPGVKIQLKIQRLSAANKPHRVILYLQLDPDWLLTLLCRSHSVRPVWAQDFGDLFRPAYGAEPLITASTLWQRLIWVEFYAKSIFFFGLAAGSTYKPLVWHSNHDKRRVKLFVSKWTSDHSSLVILYLFSLSLTVRFVLPSGHWPYLCFTRLFHPPTPCHLISQG